MNSPAEGIYGRAEILGQSIFASVKSQFLYPLYPGHLKHVHQLLVLREKLLKLSA